MSLVEVLKVSPVSIPGSEIFEPTCLGLARPTADARDHAPADGLLDGTERLLPRPTTANKKRHFYGLFGDGLETEPEMLSRLRRVFAVKPLILLSFELVEPSGIEPLTS